MAVKGVACAGRDIEELQPTALFRKLLQHLAVNVLKCFRWLKPGAAGRDFDRNSQDDKVKQVGVPIKEVGNTANGQDDRNRADGHHSKGRESEQGYSAG